MDDRKAGQTGLVQVRLLPTQHFIAFAASAFLTLQFMS
jgi:hypothetical protein